MPIISRETIDFVGPRGPEQFRREINVSATGYFTIALPPSVVEAINEKEATGHSRQEVLKNFSEALKKASTKKAVTKRVICYRVLLWGRIVRPGKFGDTNPIRHGDTFDHDASRRDGCGLQLEVGVFDETLVETGADKDFRYAEVESPIQKSVALSLSDLNGRNASPFGKEKRNRRWDQQMPWTAEREAFFVRVSAGLENLIIDLHDAFKDDKDALKLADGKRQLTLTK